jgi:DNA mismatch repair protein MSH4
MYVAFQYVAISLTSLQLRTNNTMTMLYKVAEGAVAELHYGLALAKVVPLPEGVVEHATYVAQKLERRKLRRKKTSAPVIKERRRKLILDLREHLVQAYNGVLEGEVLADWLKALQKEFVARMSTIDAEEVRAGQDSDEENEDRDEEMRDRSEYDHDEEERPSTNASQPSVISIDSRIISTASSTTLRGMSESASNVRAVSDNER